MRRIKYVRQGKQASKKQAMEMGDIAPVMLQNFETLTGFKPSLDLLEGDPHNPPTMNGIPGDPEKPSQSDVAGKSDYKNIGTVEKDKVEHEREHVKQGSTEEEEAESDTETKEEESVEDQVKKANQEFAIKYAKASQLYDIKTMAGVDVGTSKEDFVAKTANTESIEMLDRLLQDNSAMYDRVKQASTAPVQTSRVPTNFTNVRSSKRSPAFEDDLSMIIAGGE